ncbi:MAG: hypothetical protein WBH85_19325 [Thermoanaerobaculia bacterium]
MSVANVVSLLGALRKAGSPLTKAKLLALTVRGVRQLSPWERRELVSRLGVDKADWFVDRLGDETNETTAELVRELIQQAEKTEPSKWKDLATRLADPEERRRLLDEGLELLADLPDAEEPAAAAPEPPPPPADTVPVAPAPVTTKTEPGKRAPEPKPAPPKPAAAKPPDPSPSQPGAKPPAKAKPSQPAPPASTAKKPAPRAAKPSVREPARPAKPAPVSTEQTPRPPSPPVAKPALERRQAARVDARPDKKRPVRVKTGNESPTNDLASDLAATGSLVRRLRLLRERSGETESLSPEGLRRLVEAFSPGWARRRALSTLLTAGIPADFDTAFALIDETLESSTDRRWCLGSLAAGRTLTARQQEALLESLESPGWRRRLSHRLAAGIAD